MKNLKLIIAINSATLSIMSAKYIAIPGLGLATLAFPGLLFIVLLTLIKIKDAAANKVFSYTVLITNLVAAVDHLRMGSISFSDISIIFLLGAISLFLSIIGLVAVHSNSTNKT